MHPYRLLQQLTQSKVNLRILNRVNLLAFTINPLSFKYFFSQFFFFCREELLLKTRYMSETQITVPSINKGRNFDSPPERQVFTTRYGSFRDSFLNSCGLSFRSHALHYRFSECLSTWKMARTVTIRPALLSLFPLFCCPQ